MAGVPRSPRTGARNPGSQAALRERNNQRVVDALLAVGPSTQAELARHTGLSTATVSNIVKAMGAAGVVETEPTTSSGRRALSVRLSDTGAVAIGIDFGRTHLRVAVVTLGFEVVAEEYVELPLGHRAEESLDRAAALLVRLLAEGEIASGRVMGVGVGIPGPIDRRTGTVVPGGILPEWVGVDVAVLEGRLGFPVLFDNDANLGALAEITWGPHRSVSDLIFVKVGSGIGCGLILDGRTHYGAVGITGELGHLSIDDLGAMCNCGNRGCLETVASTTVMTTLLGRGAAVPLTAADVVRNALAGDPATLRVIDDAGVVIGRALAGAVNLVGPEVVVVGGPLARLGRILLDPMTRGLLRHAVPSAGETTAVVMSSLGERAESLGAAALVLQVRGSLETQRA